MVLCTAKLGLVKLSNSMKSKAPFLLKKNHALYRARCKCVHCRRLQQVNEAASGGNNPVGVSEGRKFHCGLGGPGPQLPRTPRMERANKREKIIFTCWGGTGISRDFSLCSGNFNMCLRTTLNLFFNTRQKIQLNSCGYKWSSASRA